MAALRETPSEQAQPVGMRKRTVRACDQCSSRRTRCDGRQPCRRCEEYQRSCHYARRIGKRGRRPGLREAQISLPDAAQFDDATGREIAEHPSRGSTSHASGNTRLSYTAGCDAYLTPLAAAVDTPSPSIISNLAQPRRNGSPKQHTASEGRHGHVGSSRLSTDFVAGSPSQPSDFTDTSQSPQSSQPCPSSCACLAPILPSLRGIVEADLAEKLLRLYFVVPGGSLFRCASPYVLTHVLRKASVLHVDAPRRTSPALLVTMLWVSAQEAESSLFLLPARKASVCEGLRKLMLSLIHERDRDSWSRSTAELLVRDHETVSRHSAAIERSDPDDPPHPLVDDVLTFVLLTIVLSGGNFKTDCFRWWDKALRLARLMGLNREDTALSEDSTHTARCMNNATKTANPSIYASCTQYPSCGRGCSSCDAARLGISAAEVQEERRRMFWLIFCLDRHLSLSFNAPLSILDDECQLYCPLPDAAWESFEHGENLAGRRFGPPTTVSGTGFFEYFLPLMTILGDVIHLHRRAFHPRFGSNGLMGGHDAATEMVEAVMADCASSIAEVAFRYEVDALDDAAIPASQTMTRSHFPSSVDNLAAPFATSAASLPKYQRHAQAQLVTAYSSFILHVLHVLLHGRWDAVSMLDNKDDWITSVGFMKCASHSIAASDAVSRILACDPELTFMPYLFGIYLLHGSFILLLFADRMPQIGLNESVERACETIIRAHEVCVVTLNTEFQKQFRKVLRSTLYSVRSAGGSNVEESYARRRALSLYRWSSGFTGLAL